MARVFQRSMFPFCHGKPASHLAQRRLKLWIDKWNKAEQDWAAEKVRADNLASHTAAKDERIAAEIALADKLAHALETLLVCAANGAIMVHSDIKLVAGTPLTAYRQQREAGE